MLYPSDSVWFCVEDMHLPKGLHMRLFRSRFQKEYPEMEAILPEEDVPFDQPTYDALKANVTRQAMAHGIDPSRLRFAWDEGFGTLDPNMPYTNLIRCMNILCTDVGTSKSNAVRMMKLGKFDTDLAPWRKLYLYCCEKAGKTPISE